MSITEEMGQAEIPPAPGWTADASTFGARLALIRQRMGWGNIARAAKECGLPTDSWRNWEVDGREPHRLVTIAVAIATRSGCDLDWLVYGPGRRSAGVTGQKRPVNARVVHVVGNDLDRRSDPTRPVRQTRPVAPRTIVRPAAPAAA